MAPNKTNQRVTQTLSLSPTAMKTSDVDTNIANKKYQKKCTS